MEEKEIKMPKLVTYKDEGNYGPVIVYPSRRAFNDYMVNACDLDPCKKEIKDIENIIERLTNGSATLPDEASLFKPKNEVARCAIKLARAAAAKGYNKRNNGNIAFEAAKLANDGKWYKCSRLLQTMSFQSYRKYKKDRIIFALDKKLDRMHDAALSAETTATEKAINEKYGIQDMGWMTHSKAMRLASRRGAEFEEV
jgi:hypothetical protein